MGCVRVRMRVGHSLSSCGGRLDRLGPSRRILGFHRWEQQHLEGGGGRGGEVHVSRKEQEERVSSRRRHWWVTSGRPREASLQLCLYIVADKPYIIIIIIVADQS